MPTRRALFAAAGLASATSCAALARTVSTDSVAADIERYVALGIKASGGPGDIAAGEWMEAELLGAGFAVERLAFSAPFFDPVRAELSIAGAVASVIPQAIVRQTPADGLIGPLIRMHAGDAAPDMANAIALIDLPHQRWSSALARPVRDAVASAVEAGAQAVVLITHGPSRKAIALNADGRGPMFPCPVAILAPEEAAPFYAAAAQGTVAALHLVGDAGTRPTFNLIGKLDRGRDRWVVVSTPRSGWFTCAGERSGGISAWLALARWAPQALDRYNLAFVCNSGHEYENLGAEHALESDLPTPGQTAAWVHLGANIAARDWHELTGTLLPLKGPDSQRYLVATDNLIDSCREAFAGQPGLEAPYSSDGFTAGELTNILAAGYQSVFGIFGAHRLHHAMDDDRRCVDAGAAKQALAAVQSVLAGPL